MEHVNRIINKINLHPGRMMKILEIGANIISIIISTLIIERKTLYILCQLVDFDFFLYYLVMI